MMALKSCVCSSLKAQKSLLKMRPKILEPEGMDDTKEIVSPRHSRTDTHLTSQSLWQYTKGIHRFNPAGDPVLRGRHGHRVPTLTNQESIYR